MQILIFLIFSLSGWLAGAADIIDAVVYDKNSQLVAGAPVLVNVISAQARTDEAPHIRYLERDLASFKTFYTNAKGKVLIDTAQIPLGKGGEAVEYVMSIAVQGADQNLESFETHRIERTGASAEYVFRNLNPRNRSAVRLADFSFRPGEIGRAEFHIQSLTQTKDEILARTSAAIALLKRRELKLQ